MQNLRYLRWASLAEGATLCLLTTAESVRLMLLAFIPFGAFFLTGMFKRKAAALASLLTR
jgi:hypothetical protein